MVTEETHGALLALKVERRITTMSKTVGEALWEWTKTRAARSFKLYAASAERIEASGDVSGLEPTEVREVSLQPWQEVRGLVKEWTEEGLEVRVVLEDQGDVLVIRLPGPPRRPLVEVGARVAILRTDHLAMEYVVRVLPHDQCSEVG